MKLRHLGLAAFLTLAAPGLVRADAVYFAKSGASGIQSVSGTIVRETEHIVEVLTDDGRTISIPRTNVFQIVRGAASTPGHPDVDEKSSGSMDRRHVGIKGGMNVSNVSVDPQELEDGDSLRSYAFGAWWGFPLGRRLTIQPEAYYSVKGDAETVDGYTSSTRMGYIDVPVLVKVAFLHGAPAQPSLFLGPSFAVNLSGQSRLEGEGTSVDVNVKDRIRPFELAFVVGTGVDFSVGTRTFGVDLRYSKGLSDIADAAYGSGHNDVLAILGSVGLQ